MIDWTYNPDDYNENAFTLIPAGKHRVRIENAQEKIAHSSGSEMIELTLAVSGYNTKVWKYIVLDRSSVEKEKRTNQWLGSVFSSFNITPGNFNLSSWQGKIGGAFIRHGKNINGNERAEVYYFLPRNQVDELPAWLEGSASRLSQDNINPDMADFSDVPF